jgi:hypothetical protein
LAAGADANADLDADLDADVDADLDADLDGDFDVDLVAVAAGLADRPVVASSRGPRRVATGAVAAGADEPFARAWVGAAPVLGAAGFGAVVCAVVAAGTVEVGAGEAGGVGPAALCARLAPGSGVAGDAAAAAPGGARADAARAAPASARARPA